MIWVLAATIWLLMVAGVVWLIASAADVGEDERE